MFIFNDLEKCVMPIDDCFESILMIMLPLKKESYVLSNKEKNSKQKCYLGIDYSNKKDGISYFIKCGKYKKRQIYVQKEYRTHVNKMAMQAITCFYRKDLKK